MRTVAFAIILVVLWLLSVFIVEMFSTSWEATAYDGWWFFWTIAIWSTITYRVVPMLTTFVGPTQTLVYQNFFGGTLRALTPGFHIIFPWEWYDSEEDITQREVPFRVKIEAVGGGTLEYLGKFQLRPMLDRITAYKLAGGAARIIDFLQEEIGARVNLLSSGLDIHQLRESTHIAQLNMDLNTHFCGSSNTTYWEDQFGSEITNPRIGDYSIDEATQKILDKVLGNSMTREAAASFQGLDPDILKLTLAAQGVPGITNSTSELKGFEALGQAALAILQEYLNSRQQGNRP